VKTKTFNLGAVLSISQDRLVAEDGVDALYQILNWMTGDNLYTHQLPRAMRECRPYLLRWFPELMIAETPLAQAELDKFLEGCGHDETKLKHAVVAWQAWLQISEGLKGKYEIPKIPRDDHDVKNPIDELVEMVGKDRVVVVEQEEHDPADDWKKGADKSSK
jgi:hypothetical protein